MTLENHIDTSEPANDPNDLEYFLSQDGLRMYYHQWSPEQPQKILCIVHGLAEHGGRYAHVAEYLNARGIAVFAMDLRGHGRSQGKRGHAKSYDLLLSDVEELLKTARAAHTELPMYLMGHSMGGNIVANYVLKMSTNELSGFILSSPWFRLAFEPPRWKVKLARLIGRFLPALTQPNGLNPADLSRIPEVVRDYQADPLVHNVISAGLFIACSTAGEEALQRAFEVELRGLVFHGNADRVINWQASQTYASNNDLLSFVSLEGSYHEALNDLNQEKAMQMISEWINGND